MKRLAVLMNLLLTLAAGTSFAISINPGYDYSAVPGGNQSWTGPLGMEFTVNPGNNLGVKWLGVYSSNTTLASTLWVGIYSASTGDLVSGASQTFASGTTANRSANTFWSAVDVSLAPGNYRIVASGYNGSEQNYNTFGDPGTPVVTNTFGGAVTYGSTYWWSGPTIVAPTINIDFSTWVFASPNVGRFAAGSFATPEPGTYLLMGTVGLALFLLRRSRRTSDAKQ